MTSMAAPGRDAYQTSFFLDPKTENARLPQASVSRGDENEGAMPLGPSPQRPATRTAAGRFAALVLGGDGGTCPAPIGVLSPAAANVAALDGWSKLGVASPCAASPSPFDCPAPPASTPVDPATAAQRPPPVWGDVRAVVRSRAAAASPMPSPMGAMTPFGCGGWPGGGTTPPETPAEGIVVAPGGGGCSFRTPVASGVVRDGAAGPFGTLVSVAPEGGAPSGGVAPAASPFGTPAAAPPATAGPLFAPVGTAVGAPVSAPTLFGAPPTVSPFDGFHCGAPADAAAPDSCVSAVPALIPTDIAPAPVPALACPTPSITDDDEAAASTVRAACRGALTRVAAARVRASRAFAVAEAAAREAAASAAAEEAEVADALACVRAAAHGSLARSRVANLREVHSVAATMIQVSWRLNRDLRAQSRGVAATTVQAGWRGAVGRREAAALRAARAEAEAAAAAEAAAIQLQAGWRGAVGRREAAALRAARAEAEAAAAATSAVAVDSSVVGTGSVATGTAFWMSRLRLAVLGVLIMAMSVVAGRAAALTDVVPLPLSLERARLALLDDPAAALGKERAALLGALARRVASSSYVPARATELLAAAADVLDPPPPPVPPVIATAMVVGAPATWLASLVPVWALLPVAATTVVIVVAAATAALLRRPGPSPGTRSEASGNEPTFGGGEGWGGFGAPQGFPLGSPGADGASSLLSPEPAPLRRHRYRPLWSPTPPPAGGAASPRVLRSASWSLSQRRSAT